MSLILEALRKLERDRHTHERGFLVLAQPARTPTGERAWTRGPALLGVAALAGGAVAAALLWPGLTQPAPVPAAVPAAAPVTLAAAATLPAAPPPRVAWPEDRVPTPKTAVPAVTATSRERPPVQAEPAQADVPVADAEEPAPEAPEAVTVTGPLRLEAIAQRDGQPVAIVSGQMVRVGDRIGAGTVVRIGTIDVEIETDGRRQILRF